jgi:hypothetical protein
MFGLGIPAMMGIGAGIGLLTNRKNPLGGALTGGLLGGAGGALGNYMQGGSFLQNAAAKPIANAVVPGSLESMGMKTIGETAYNPEYFAGLGFGTPIYTGNEGLLSQIGTGAGSIWDTAKANIPDYVTPQNMIGAANLLANMQAPQQTPTPSPSSSMRPGSVQGLNVNYGMAQPIKRRGYA